jgi:polyisoprenoid-binding protein YceI
MRRLLTLAVLAALAACAQKESPSAPQGRDRPAATAEQEQGEPAPAAAMAADIPAGSYTIDRSHTSLLFKVNHLGFSHFTARFKRVDAQLQFDPANLAATKLTATVDPHSLETDYPDPATVDFNAQLQGAEWLNAAQFPQIKFETTQVEPTGNHGMRVTGNLTLRGVTHPVVLEATFNGGYSGHPLDPHARIGFSAHGALKRSDFGIGVGVPGPGSNLGVGDRVEIIIEAEFSGPAKANAAAPSTPSS